MIASFFRLPKNPKYFERAFILKPENKATDES
jgi:hypothetical protein